jgi:hypothetical protein
VKTIYYKLYSELGEAVHAYREDPQHKTKERISKSLRSGLPSALFPTSSRLFFASYLYRVDIEHRVDTGYERSTAPLRTAVLKRRIKR